ARQAVASIGAERDVTGRLHFFLSPCGTGIKGSHVDCLVNRYRKEIPVNTHAATTRLAAAVALSALSLCGTVRADDRSDRSHDSVSEAFHAKIGGTCTNKDDFSFTGIPAGLVPGSALRIYCVV